MQTDDQKVVEKDPNDQTRAVDHAQNAVTQDVDAETKPAYRFIRMGLVGCMLLFGVGVLIQKDILKLPEGVEEYLPIIDVDQSPLDYILTKLDLKTLYFFQERIILDLPIDERLIKLYVVLDVGCKDQESVEILKVHKQALLEQFMTVMNEQSIDRLSTQKGREVILSELFNQLKTSMPEKGGKGISEIGFSNFEMESL